MSLPWLSDPWQQLNRARLQQRLPHALLFSGPEGVGKRVLARQLAESLLCERPDTEGRACGACAPCGWLHAGTHPDLLLLQPPEEGKVIRVDQVRELCTSLTMTSHGGRHKVAIVFPADAMNVNAANSLLKTLEEPADSTLLVLISAAPGRLPATIRSRCQQLQVALPSEAIANAWLREQGLEAVQAERSLRLVRGAVLDACLLAEQGGIEQYDQCLDQLCQLFDGLLLPTRVAKEWSCDNERRILGWWQGWLQDLVRWKQAGKRPIDPQTARNLQEVAEAVDCRQLFDLASRVTSALDSLGSGLNQQLVLEDLLISWSGLGCQRSKKRIGNR